MATIQKYNDEFHVYLMSNGSIGLYPDNTAGEFRNELATPIDFGAESDSWEVGISELQIPTAYCNIVRGINSSLTVATVKNTVYEFMEQRRKNAEIERQRRILAESVVPQTAPRPDPASNTLRASPLQQQQPVAPAPTTYSCDIHRPASNTATSSA